MGLMLDEVVAALHPEHREHTIKILHKGDAVTPDHAWWSCSCGVSGTIGDAELRRATEEGQVTRT